MPELHEVIGPCVLLPACLFAALCGYIAAEATYYQWYLGRGLERDCGFRHGATYPRFGGRHHAALTVVWVEPGGVFDRAGIRAGELVPGLSVTDLFRLLHRHRGREAALTVTGGGDGPPPGEREGRVIRFTVPEASKAS